MKFLTFDTDSRRLFAIGLPVIIQNLVYYIQIQTDMAMVGHYDPLYLAAIGNVTFPFLIFYNFLLGLTTGATVMIAHSIGASKISRARRYAEVSVVYNSIVSCAFLILLVTLASTIMTALGTSGDVNLYGTRYMEILSYSMLTLGVELSIVAILQGMGITKHIMISGFLKMFLNIFLDWIMIYGKLGCPEMGIEGAAWATTLSNVASAIYLAFALVYSRKIFFRLGKGLFRPTWSIEKENVAIGLPNGFEAIMWAVAQVLMIRFVNAIDEISSGIYILVTRLQAFTFFFYLGLARGTMTLVGQYMGAKNFKSAIKIGLLSLRYSFILCVITAAAFIFFPETILLIFTTDKTIIQESIPLLKLISISIFPIAVNVIIGHAIRGMKDSKWMMYTQIIGSIFTVSTCAILIFGLEVGIIGVFITIIADESLRALLNFYRFYKGMKLARA